MLTPSPVFPPKIWIAHRGLGRRRLRGLGQSEVCTDPTDPTCLPVSTTQNPWNPTLPTTGTPTSSSGGVDWTSIINSAIKSTGSVVAQQTNPFAPKNIPAGTYYAQGPGGTIISTAGAGSPYTAGITALNTTGSALNSMLPILLIGGAVVMFMSMAHR